jgi:hypothetical protein
VQSAAAQGQRITDGYPPGGQVADAVCRWRDPMPCLVQGLGHVRRALLSRTAKRVPGSPVAGSES